MGMSDKRYVNQTELANMKNPKVTRQAIRKAKEDGRIVIHGTGRAARIDLECPLTVAYLKTPSTPGKSLAPTPPKAQRKRTGKKGAAAAPAPPPPPGTAGEDPPPSPVNVEQVQAFLDNGEIKSLKIKEELEKLRLKNRETRGELIRRDVVQAFMHRLHEIDNGQWKTLGLKVASDVAAKLGLEDDAAVREICTVIEREVLAVLKLIKREQNRFLKKIGAEKMPKEKEAA